MNYARWLPIHLMDMMALEERHSQIAEAFHAGKFVVHKSDRDFSAMAIDQVHEQANAVIKGDGGAVGITEDPSALKRWMVAGPAVSQLVAQYTEGSVLRNVLKQTKHHEQTHTAQTTFLEKVQGLTNTLEEMGNPFQEETRDLLSLDTKDIASPDNAARIDTHLSTGTAYFEARLEALEHEDTSSIYAPIKKTKMDFFQPEKLRTIAKEKVMKEDCQLFSKLFISCQNRECDLQEFFRYENRPFLATLSDGGRLHVCQKSQLAVVLEGKVTLPGAEPLTDAISINVSALVNTLPPRMSNTFADYAEMEFIPKVDACARKYHRTDVVFDPYQTLSLKSETRSNRSQGARRRVTGTGKFVKKLAQLSAPFCQQDKTVCLPS